MKTPFGDRASQLLEQSSCCSACSRFNRFI